MKLTKDEKILVLYSRMNKLVSTINYANEGKVWDDFWKLNINLGKYVYIDYYDPNTSYLEDMQARLSAIRGHLVSIHLISN